MQRRRTIILIASTLIAQEAKVTPLMSKDLAEFPGKEGVMITVVYPPGAHGITATQPDRVNADLLEFLKKGRKTCGVSPAERRPEPKANNLQIMITARRYSADVGRQFWPQIFLAW